MEPISAHSQAVLTGQATRELVGKQAQMTERIKEKNNESW
jgi:hypothetical protein